MINSNNDNNNYTLVSHTRYRIWCQIHTNMCVVVCGCVCMCVCVCARVSQLCVCVCVY